MFAGWGDSAFYVLAGGGSFEASQPSWTLDGGAAVTSGNESWSLGGPADGRSLRLPGGSSATSSLTCSPTLAPVVRFFARNVGSSGGRLHVELIVNGDSHKAEILDGGTIAVGGGWNVTEPLAFAWPGDKAGAVAFQVRLTPVGAGAAFQVDDVYIDPYQCR